MNQINKNKALKSLEFSLENHDQLIDSRTEIDRLDFLVNFASLLNFYDDKNEINEDWSPFLLKDPSFLLASIAKTPFKKMYTLFLQTCVSLEKALKEEKIKNSTKVSNIKQKIEGCKRTIINYKEEEIDRLIAIISEDKISKLEELKNVISKNEVFELNELDVIILALGELEVLFQKLEELKRLKLECKERVEINSLKGKILEKKKEIQVKVKDLQLSLEILHKKKLEYKEKEEKQLRKIISELKEQENNNSVLLKLEKFEEFLLKNKKTVLNILKHLIFDVKQLDKNGLKEKITTCFKQLFHQLLHVFNLIERWIYYMLQCSLDYSLKRYVIQEVKEKYNHLLWGILWLKQQLHHSDLIEGIEAVKNKVYQSYDKNIWKSGHKKIPYWELLGLTYPITDSINSLQAIATALKKLGEKIFSFLNSIVEYAPIQLKEIELKKDLFPDTLLLKTFTKLMEVYQKQINGLTKKHLNFYYKDILHQKKRPAKPDSVFVCTDLQDNIATFELPKGTLFNGGEYEDNTTILYKSTQKVSLTPAKIAEAYTLSKVPVDSKVSVVSEKRYELYLKKEEDINGVQTNEEGETQSWKTFGSENIKEAKKVALGFVFASPMLFLNEGKRKITITITFKEKLLNLNLFKHGNYALSSEEEWFPLTYIKGKRGLSNLKIKQNKEDLCQVFFEINLKEDDPAIVTFLESKQGLDSVWPMFRMKFSEYSNSNFKLKITSIKIDVNVQELQTFQLYNDFGLLESEKPFQPFGPTPNKDQSFTIGNAEVFSKPITNFTFQMNWDNLPKNFISYYQQYNKYKANFYKKPPIKKTQTLLEGIWKNLEGSFLGNKKNIASISSDIENIIDPFNDKAFKVDFQLLQNKKWIPVEMNYTESILNNLLQENVGDFKRTLFQGVPLLVVGKEGILKAFELIHINNRLTIDQLFTIQDFFEATIELKFEEEKKDNIKIQGLLELNNKLDVNAILKVKEALEFETILERENTIKLVDVFEIKPSLKAKEVFVVNNDVSIENILAFENYLRELDILKSKKQIVKSVSIQLEKELIISDSLEFCSVIVLDESLLLKDVLSGKKTVVFKIKKELKINQLFQEVTINEIIPFQGKIIIENENNKTSDLTISGKISLDGSIYVDNTLLIHQKSNLITVLEVAKEEAKKVNSVTYEKLFNYSVFGSTEIGTTQKDINPTIQNNPLELTETTTSGFLRMKLTNPTYGFGALLYPKVVSAIAMYNADLLSLAFNKQKVTFQEEANEPYTPIVGLFKGAYMSSITYNFSEQNSIENFNYPIQCFYEDTFKNYKVYDSFYSTKQNKGIRNGFPAFLPAIKQKGTLFLALENITTPAEVRFYFELVQEQATLSGKDKKDEEITYSYLSEKGWKELPVISDTTNKFNCSGIITFNLLSRKLEKHYTMPSNKNWITIAVNKNPDKYCQTSFLKTNGIKLERTGNLFRTKTKKPEIKANTIESTYKAIPEIAAVLQPFSSFGGKASETEVALNKRVSIRLKTKDRVVTNEDYYRSIRESFTEVFYPKIVFNKTTRKTNVFLVQNIQNWQDTNAFRPIVSKCLLLEVQKFLRERASSFADIQVKNFDLKYLKIEGDVTIITSRTKEGAAKEVNHGLNIFLSPWIMSAQSQIAIDEGVSVAQISEFIKSYTCVKSVGALTIYLGKYDKETKEIQYSEPYQTITPIMVGDTFLLVPSLDNEKITYKK